MAKKITKNCLFWVLSLFVFFVGELEAGAGIVFYKPDMQGRIWLLLGKQRGRNVLDLLGGSGKANESYLDAALRESVEESSALLDPVIQRGFDVKQSRTYIEFLRATTDPGSWAFMPHSDCMTFVAPYPGELDPSDATARAAFSRTFSTQRKRCEDVRLGCDFLENDDLVWVPCALFRRIALSNGGYHALVGGIVPQNREAMDALASAFGNQLVTKLSCYTLRHWVTGPIKTIVDWACDNEGKLANGHELSLPIGYREPDRYARCR